MGESLNKFWKWFKGDSWGSFIVKLIIAFILIKFVLLPGLGLVTGSSMPLVIVESCSMYHPTDMQEIFNRQTICGGGEIEIKMLSNGYELINNLQNLSFDSIGFVKEGFPNYVEIDVSEAKIGNYVVYIFGDRKYLQEITEITNGQYKTYKTKGEYPCLTEEMYKEYDLEFEDTVDWGFQNGLNKGDVIFVIGANKDNTNVGDVLIFDQGNLKNPIIHRVISVDGLGRATTKGDNNLALLPQEEIINPERFIGKAVFRIPAIGWAKLIFFESTRQASERGLCS